jgi:hypothetical protein
MMPLETNRQDQANISMTIGGRPMPFLFQKKSGGKVTAEGSKTAPGAMQPKVAHGGIQEIEDGSFEFEFVPARDHETIQWLLPRVGKERATGAEHILDAEGNVLDTLRNFQGSFDGLDTGQYDATSAEPRMGAIDLTLDGTPG